MFDKVGLGKIIVLAALHYNPASVLQKIFKLRTQFG
jgi:hypothetical protein